MTGEDQALIGCLALVAALVCTVFSVLAAALPVHHEWVTACILLWVGMGLAAIGVLLTACKVVRR